MFNIYCNGFLSAVLVVSIAEWDVDEEWCNMRDDEWTHALREIHTELFLFCFVLFWWDFDGVVCPLHIPSSLINIGIHLAIVIFFLISLYRCQYRTREKQRGALPHQVIVLQRESDPEQLLVLWFDHLQLIGNILIPIIMYLRTRKWELRCC